MGSGTFKASDGCMISFRLHPAPGPRAPRIALIHSLALDRSIWDGVVAGIKEGAEILTFDCRGHGRSERRAMAYTPELFARDLAELMDHVGWQAASIAGCSMGGCVALAFAAGYAARTQSLGLIDTTAWYGPKAHEEWRERAALARAKGFGGLIDFQTSRWFSDAFCAAAPDLIRAIAEVYIGNDVACYEASCAMLAQVDLRSSLAAISAPTAILVGEEDYATPVEMSHQLHEVVKGSSLTIIPGARHLTPVEKPRDIAPALLKLLPEYR
jgi:3-oxoadipate enol-lactonase